MSTYNPTKKELLSELKTALKDALFRKAVKECEHFLSQMTPETTDETRREKELSDAITLKRRLGGIGSALLAAHRMTHRRVPDDHEDLELLKYKDNSRISKAWLGPNIDQDNLNVVLKLLPHLVDTLSKRLERQYPPLPKKQSKEQRKRILKNKLRDELFSLFLSEDVSPTLTATYTAKLMTIYEFLPRESISLNELNKLAANFKSQISQIVNKPNSEWYVYLADEAAAAARIEEATANGPDQDETSA